MGESNLSGNRQALFSMPGGRLQLLSALASRREQLVESEQYQLLKYSLRAGKTYAHDFAPKHRGIVSVAATSPWCRSDFIYMH
jgi:hypothetical protein